MTSHLAMLWACIVKDTRMILRDRGALALFFVMPVLFVLILSLALRDAFGEQPGASFPVLLVDAERGEVGQALARSLRANPNVRLVQAEQADEGQVRQWLRAGEYKFAILLPPDATAQARRRVGEIAAGVPAELMLERPVDIHVFTDPALRADYTRVMEGMLNLALHGVEMQLAHAQLEQNLKAMLGERYTELPAMEQFQVFGPVQSVSVSDEQRGRVPTSVQQNAPAWTLLAMFFLTVPLSVSFIREREQGSLFRLQTMSVPSWVVLGGKAVPFFVINQVQMVSILAVSIHVLPLLGGDRLELGNAPLAILLLGAAASLAAIGFGIVVALYAKTMEQAASFSLATVMIMGALGGIMVPKAVMPALMQKLAVLSPLSWGLDGFLDLFVRDGGVADVLPEALSLLAFSAVCHGLAMRRYRVRV